MSVKILKNTTGSDIEVNSTGVTIPASGQYTIDPINYSLWTTTDAITEITTDINSGDLVVNDGVDDITVANGFTLQHAIDYIKYPDFAFHIRFEAEPERSNGFASKNVQEAIEEAKSGNRVEGRTYQIEFFNNGNTANKWLFHVPTNEATDQLPYVTAWDIDIFGILYTNKNTPTDCDVEFYVNGTNPPAKVYTLEVRNYKSYWETTMSSFFSLSTGDELSIFVRKVGQSTPSSVEIDLNLRVTSTTTGAGGSL